MKNKNWPLIFLAMLIIVTIMIDKFGNQPKPLPVAYQTIYCTPYKTVHDAVEAAVHESLSMSKKYEMGGTIYKQDDGFCYTKPITTSNSKKVNYSIQNNTSNLVAIYHTHPGKYISGKYFSPTDIVTAVKLKAISYIYVSYDNSIRELKWDHLHLYQRDGKNIEGEIIKKLP